MRRDVFFVYYFAIFHAEINNTRKREHAKQCDVECAVRCVRIPVAHAGACTPPTIRSPHSAASFSLKPFMSPSGTVHFQKRNTLFRPSLSWLDESWTHPNPVPGNLFDLSQSLSVFRS